ncbi:MAG: gluconate transporter [Armatimonadetes bacterium]|nr:gluconate transporter [Armatimonadota bacterium]
MVSPEMNAILVAVVGIASLIVLIMVLRLHAFVALLLVSMGVGLGAGMSFEQVLTATQKGMGDVLGYIAIVVGLGSMFGQMLESSGGAQRLARTLVGVFGIERAAWALALAGFLIAIPVFFDVGFVILVPLVYSLSQSTGRSLLAFALPLVAGLAVAHAFIPPTPGPMAAAAILKADLGRVILYGIVAGLPAAILAGPVWGHFISSKLHIPIPQHLEMPEELPDEKLPSFGLVLGLLLIPILLIVANTVSNARVPGGALADFFAFVGHPFVALTIAALLSFTLLGTLRGMTSDEVQQLANRSLGPAGMIILVTGAGGVFKQMLTDSNIGATLASSIVNLGLSPVLLAFLVAAVVRVSQGSATVAMMTAAGLIAPVLALEQFAGVDRALVTIAVAAGSTVLSHVNDSGFWMLKEFLGMSVAQTLKSWTVLTTILGITGFLAAVAWSTLGLF